MSSFSKDSFEFIVKNNGLVKIMEGTYLLVDCNVMFDFDNSNRYANAHGFIPMDLAIEMYEAFKDLNQNEISNTTGHSLVDPKKIVRHLSLSDYDRVILAARNHRIQKKSYDEIRAELIEKALVEDYANCYINHSYIYTPEAFQWFIDTTKKFYAEKRMNDKTIGQR